MVIVEEYCESVHGSCDDCDFVVIFTGEDENLAREVALRLSVCDFHDTGNVFWCCHA